MCGPRPIVLQAALWTPRPWGRECPWAPASAGAQWRGMQGQQHTGQGERAKETLQVGGLGAGGGANRLPPQTSESLGLGEE